jgi:hypothetical protein
VPSASGRCAPSAAEEGLLCFSWCCNVPEARLLTRGPDQEEPPVSSLLEFGHDAVDDVRLGCEDVDCVHVPLSRPPLLEALDVWAGQNRGLTGQWAQRTRNVEVEDIIFLDDIVYQLLAVLVDYEYLPLLDALAMAAGP